MIHYYPEFQDWIKADELEITVLYVPANCTNLFQPCELYLRRLFKYSVKQSLLCDATLRIINAIQYLNTASLNSSDNLNYIGASL